MEKIKAAPVLAFNGNGHTEHPSHNLNASAGEAKHVMEPGTSTQPADRSKKYQSLRGILAEFHSSMFKHGYDRAVSSGTLEMRHEDTDAIEKHAARSARECARDEFDTGTHLHDQMHKAEHGKHIDDRTHAEQAKKYAYAEMRDRAKDAKQAKALTNSKKTLWIVLGIAAAVGLAITFVFTFHDVFFLLPDEMLAWVVSYLAALVIGGSISVMILSDTGSDGEHSATNWIGLSAGILIAVGFGVARLRDAGSYGEYALSLALMLIEFGLVIGLEGVAARIRAINRHNSAATLQEMRATALYEEAAEHYRYCEHQVHELNTTVMGDIDYVEERDLRHHRIAELEEAMVAAGLDGYNSGISHNRGITIKGGLHQ